MARYRVLSLGILAAFGIVASLAHGGEDKLRPGTALKDEPGTVRRVGDGKWAIVPDFDKETRFAPEGLAEELQKDELRVSFSGTVGEVPPNVRMWGIPLKLSEIRAIPSS